MKFDMKSQMEALLLKQKEDLQLIVKEYLDFIDKIMVDKKTLKNQLDQALEKNEELIHIIEMRGRGSFHDSKPFYDKLEQQNVELMRELDDSKKCINQLKREIVNQSEDRKRNLFPTQQRSIQDRSVSSIDQHQLQKDEALNIQNQDLKLQVERLWSELQDVNQQIYEYESRFSQLDQLLDNLEQEKNAAMKNVEHLRRQILEIKLFYEEKIKYLNNQNMEELEKLELILFQAAQQKDQNQYKLRQILQTLRQIQNTEMYHQ